MTTFSDPKNVSLPEKLVKNLKEFNFLKSAHLNEDFVKETRGIASFLSDIKAECNYFDQKNPSEEQQIQFIEDRKKIVFLRLDKHFVNAWDITEMLTEREYRIHQLYYQRELSPFFYTPPLNQRIYDKPLGYDGDFMIMEYYYEGGYRGRNTFEKLIHRYTLSIPVAVATVKRIEYIYRWIKEAVSSRDEEARIMSLGCGPAIEIINFIDKEKPNKKIVFTLLDMEPLAIKHVKEQMKKLRDKLSTCKTNYLNLDILKLVKSHKKDQSLHGQDLIYATGLFDYLNDKVARKLIEAAFSLLGNGGKLLLTNARKGETHRAYLELLGEWHLIYRDEEDIMKLCAGLPKTAKKTLTKDRETGTKIYLEIRK